MRRAFGYLQRMGRALMGHASVEQQVKTEQREDAANGTARAPQGERAVTTVVAPMTGELRPITAVPDEVFSQRMLGDGFCVFPTEGQVVSPISGSVMHLFPTGHAVGLQTADGIEVLVHIGIDTVKLQGQGFKAHVKEGAAVAAGDVLVEVDLDVVGPQVPSLATPVIFTNLEGRPWELQRTGRVSAGDAVALVGAQGAVPVSPT